MSKIFWDTNIFIYLFERNPDYWQEVKRQRERMIERNDTLLTSAITLGEVQVAPRRADDADGAAYYRNLITNTADVVPFDDKAADAYAWIRARTPVRGPDALQLACAAAAQVDFFVTNDKRLHPLIIEGIDYILPLNRVPL